MKAGTGFIFYADSEEKDYQINSDWELTLESISEEIDEYEFDEIFGDDEFEEDDSFFDISAEDASRRLIYRLVSFATEYGLSGNIWQQWIAYLLIADENPCSLACERCEVDEASTMIKIAGSEFELIYEIFRKGPATEGRPGCGELLPLLEVYQPPYAAKTENLAGAQIRELASELAGAANAYEFAKAVTNYYERHGVGIYGLHRAFRTKWEDDCLEIVPVREVEDISFDTLIGCDDQTETLRHNTESFIKGIAANNVLLYGDSGTGKSTSVRALMHDYYRDGLRLIELGKADRKRLPEIMSEIKKRNYKFIIFMDDLSFEEDESDYKELKAMLEGALESKEENVLIYATSNRRHLIRETWKDRNDMEFADDVHRSDTMEEKLSLAGRFGVTIYYGKPDYKEYMSIVTALAKREGLAISDDDLADEARRWSLRHGSTSGRTASQLIKWLQQ